MLSVSWSGAENASVRTHMLSSAARCKPGDSRGKDAAPAKHVPWGPGAAATPPAAQSALRKEQECQACALLPLCAFTRCRAPSHHWHSLKGRLAKSTTTASPPNSLKSFILQGKEKVETDYGKELTEPHIASSSCRLDLPHHLLFFFFISLHKKAKRTKRRGSKPALLLLSEQLR